MLGWYFTDTKERLRFGDGRAIAVGVTHKVDGDPILCSHGLHAAKTILGALPNGGHILYRVRLGGKIVHDDDKSVATERTYLRRLDAEPMLRAFARLCALDVVSLWDCPPIVREYLEGDNETLHTAAWALAAARDARIGNDTNAALAARTAAEAAVGRPVANDAALDAAQAAARAIAYVAIHDATPHFTGPHWAEDAAWSAAQSATKKKQSKRLEKMTYAAMRKSHKEKTV